LRILFPTLRVQRVADGLPHLVPRVVADVALPLLPLGATHREFDGDLSVHGIARTPDRAVDLAPQFLGVRGVSDEYGVERRGHPPRHRLAEGESDIRRRQYSGHR
jgi:hypothetical protein